MDDLEPLRRRIRSFCQAFNRGDWARCFDFVDPTLRNQGRIEFAQYAESLAAFRAYYGKIDIWHLRANIHGRKSAKHDDRAFAYVYVFWQDDRNGLHVFRERGFLIPAAGTLEWSAWLPARHLRQEHELEAMRRAASLVFSTNRRIFSESFRPGVTSTPLATSTP